MQAYVAIDANEQECKIQVQDNKCVKIWKNEFSSSYIEEITAKTGRKKSYLEFLRMFMKGVLGSDSSIFLDLLGLNEL